MLDASFFKVSFHHINYSEFLFLTHNIPGISMHVGKGGEQPYVFECMVAVTCSP